MNATLKIQRHYPNMPLPSRGHPTDAGLDLTAMGVESLRPHLFAFDTGISVHPDRGYYCEVVPRSSIIKTDFMMANSVGVIDEDYRGRIKIILRYLGEGTGEAEAQTMVGNRIAQLLVRRREDISVEAVDDLSETNRGVGGFGSTGD